MNKTMSKQQKIFMYSLPYICINVWKKYCCANEQEKRLRLILDEVYVAAEAY